MADKATEISSILEEGPLAGASVPLEVWAEINGVVIEPLDLEAIDAATG